MRLYRCSHCAHPAFFEKPRCRRCGAVRGLVAEEFSLRPAEIAVAPGPSAPARHDELLEPCRSILRHFHRESGHYYWQVLVADDPARLASCRELFGDERRDYAQALRAHYHNGPPANWQSEYVSPYASAHPLEDFAETWSHYLRLVALVTVMDARGRPIEGYPEREVLTLAGPAARDEGFCALLRRWLLALLRANRLSRRQAREDPYPFAPPPAVIRKLAWIHRLVQDALRVMRRPQLASSA